jgi:hypothetical protein
MRWQAIINYRDDVVELIVLRILPCLLYVCCILLNFTDNLIGESWIRTVRGVIIHEV